MLARGEIHLSGLGVLAAHLTDANHRELLANAAGKSKRAIEELIAARFSPKDALPFKVTEDITAMGSATEPPPESEVVAGPRREARGTTPVAEDTFRVSCTINGACRDKLAEAQALLAHRVPSGDVRVVLEAALDELLIKLRKRKFGETHAPRRAQRALKPGSRHIPAEVKRQVSERDGRQCTFVGETGRRCSGRNRHDVTQTENSDRFSEITTVAVSSVCNHRPSSAALILGASKTLSTICSVTSASV